MTRLLFTDTSLWHRLEHHLNTGTTERFAFAYTRTIGNLDRLYAVEIVDLELIDDNDVTAQPDGYGLNGAALDRVHNRALQNGHGLLEVRNHDMGPRASHSSTKPASNPPPTTPLASCPTALTARPSTPTVLSTPNTGSAARTS